MSWTDYLIGQFVANLKSAGLFEDAVLVLWGDHGYQLGDNNQWSKVDVFEHSARIPLLFRFPDGKTGSTGVIAEEIDIFPTLAGLATGQSIPSCPDNKDQSRQTLLCSDGKDLSGVIRGTQQLDTEMEAFIQVPRASVRNGQGGCTPGDEQFMGMSVRIVGYRYTEWVAFDNATGTPDWSHCVGRELYLHNADEGGSCDYNIETTNVVNMTQYAQVVDRLSKRLRQVFV